MPISPAKNYLAYSNPKIKSAGGYITQTEELFNEMGRMAKIGAWELDTETMQQLWTDETYEIHDVDKATYNPNVDREVSSFTPKSKPVIEKAVYDAIHLGKPYDLVLEMVTVKGNHKIVRCIGNIYTEAGKVKKVYGSVQDITEIKKVEEDLKKSERRLKEAQELAHLGYWYWDVKTGNVEWSEEVYKIFRLTRGEFTPQIDSILKLSPWPEDHERNKDLIDRAVKSREPGSYEQKFLRPDKSVGYYYSTFRGNYDEQGELVSIVGTIVDITEHKEVEERLREIDKAKTEFVSLASHQLRTPLTAVNWYSEMLLQSGVVYDALKRKEYIERIYKGSRQMVGIVNALLDVSRIELGKLVVERKPVNSITLMNDVINEQRSQVDEKKLLLASHFPENIPLIDTDPGLLRMIFQNLLSNAVKYTPSGGHIDIRVAEEKAGLLVTFSDTGYGIPKKDQDKIFTKMFRAENIKEKISEGTGLGLYIVKSLLAGIGGDIRFESEENKGTRFYVNLPFNKM